jgi:hypothetical protein
MTFELWDTESGNLLAVYPSRSAALTFVKTVVTEDGQPAVEQWELFEMQNGERAESIAYGEELAALARAESPTAA